VATDFINLDTFFFKQDVQAGTQGTKGCEQQDPHEICQVEIVLGRTDDQGPAFGEMGDVFAGNITVSQEAAAVRVALERHVEQRVVELRLGNIKAEFTSQFAE